MQKQGDVESAKQENQPFPIPHLLNNFPQIGAMPLSFEVNSGDYVC
jgi:hypothetical protein